MIEANTTNKSDSKRTIINIESQKQLARLLATEDIQVSIGNYQTAYFDIKNRVLGLPAWNTDSKSLSDLLVGHEVGHALYTPEDGIELFKERFPEIPFDICNIVEDIRIERMIQNKYPGLVKAFTEGYSYFKENDIFEIEDKNLNELSFVDRLNLKAKLRTLIDIEFNDEETKLVELCNNVKTYDDVLDAVEKICEYIENNKEDLPENKDPNPTSSSEDEGEAITNSDQSEDQGDPSNNQDLNSDDEGETSDDPVSGANDGSYDYDSDYKSKTQEAIDDHLKDLGNVNEDEIIIDSIDKKIINKLIYSVEDVRDVRKKSYPKIYKALMENQEIHECWLKFKNDTKKNVSTLCREFERRKAAHQYQRATQSRTGSINVNKLHSYKYDDQIFKSITNLADAKNHGMNIFIDVSGSMGNCITDVIKQTIQLVMFCKTVGIPFKVYSFTSSGTRYEKDNKGIWVTKSKKEFFEENFTMGNIADIYGVRICELINSDLKKMKYEKALKELYIQSGDIHKSFRDLSIEHASPNYNYNHTVYPTYNCMSSVLEDMGGTPLYETLIIAHTLIKQFKEKNNIEKMTTVFLTDGDGQIVSCIDMTKTDDPKSVNSYWGNAYYSSKKYIKVGKSTMDISIKNQRCYRDLVELIQKECNSKMIGFFLCSGKQAGMSHGQRALTYDKKYKTAFTRGQHLEDCRKKAVKMKSNCYELGRGFGYDAYFIIDNLKKLRLDDESEYEVPETVNTDELLTAANRTKLATSFSKYNVNKRQSRIFLNTFIDTIA